MCRIAALVVGAVGALVREGERVAGGRVRGAGEPDYNGAETADFLARLVSLGCQSQKCPRNFARAVSVQAQFGGACGVKGRTFADQFELS